MLIAPRQTVLECRSRYSQPPEALSGSKAGMKSNVYAFGMLMYEVLLCKEPYQDEDQEVRPSFSSALSFTRIGSTCARYQALHTDVS